MGKERAVDVEHKRPNGARETEPLDKEQPETLREQNPRREVRPRAPEVAPSYHQRRGGRSHFLTIARNTVFSGLFHFTSQASSGRSIADARHGCRKQQPLEQSKAEPVDYGPAGSLAADKNPWLPVCPQAR